MAISPFLCPDKPGYPAIFADGLVHLLERTGLDRWSVREIARWMKVTPAAVLAKFSRADVVRLAVSEHGHRWVAWSARPPYDSGLPASLPESAEEVHGVRVWSLLGELARSEQLAGRGAAQNAYVAAERDARASLAQRLQVLAGREVTGDELDATAALVTGLRALLAAHGPIVSIETARRIVLDHVALLRGPAPPGPAIAGPAIAGPVHRGAAR